MVMPFYGPVITDALADTKTSLKDLRVMRDHASAIVEAQGDLKSALKALDEEIKRREKSGGN